MKTEWIFLLNVFYNATIGSFRLALRITIYHYSALKSKVADPFILALFTAYEPIHTKFVAAYNAWKKQMALQTSKTLAFEKLLKELSSKKARKWVGTISGIYDKDTAEYKFLLPHNSSPLQKGTQADRVEAVQQLIDAIGSDVALAALKAEIEAFYILLDKAFTEQKGSISDTLALSKVLEEARVDMCNFQYADLGGLMQYYYLKPLLTGDFFDQKAIRTGEQVLFMCTVKPKGVHTVFERTLNADDKLSLENDGVTELRFYLAAEKDAAIGSTFVTVAANAKITVTASELGSVDAMHFLIAYNPDAVNKGEFTVELV